MTQKILSIAEIDEIERAFELGVSTLGAAADALLFRWTNELKDEETAMRLIFLRWFSRTEPPFLTGLNDLEEKLPAVEAIIEEFGGEDGLSAESKFILAILSFGGYAWGMGDEATWKNKARQLFLVAADAEPKSYLFADWKFLIEEKIDSTHLKTKIESEMHARFYGRGSMGNYVLHILSGMVRR